MAGRLASPHAPYLPAQEFVIPEEEAEWVGLTLDEAVEKQRLLEEKVSMCECQLPYLLGWAQWPSRRIGWGSSLPCGLPRSGATTLGGLGKDLPLHSCAAGATVLWVSHGTFPPLMVLTLFCTFWPIS